MPAGAEQKPITEFMAVEDLQRTRVDQPRAERSAPGLLEMEELERQADVPEEEKKTQEMSGPEILALQLADAMEHLSEEDQQPTVKIEPDEDSQEREEAGEKRINVDLMKTVREPD